MKLLENIGLSQANRQLLTVLCLCLAVVALSSISPEAYAAPGSMAIPSNGKSLESIINNITFSSKDAGVMLTALDYLGALAFVFMGALKCKAYGEQPEKKPLKVPVMYMTIAAILAALPDFLGPGLWQLCQLSFGQGATLFGPP